tara:strand:- start:15930 stop:16196 length:267 start_codon:yes stop_codon:yes gene_type:complete
MTDETDTAGDATYRVTAGELRQFVESLESSNGRIANEQAHKKEIKAAAKAKGYDGKALDELVRLRAADPGKVAEFETQLELYKTTMGM